MVVGLDIEAPLAVFHMIQGLGQDVCISFCFFSPHDGTVEG